MFNILLRNIRRLNYIVVIVIIVIDQSTRFSSLFLECQTTSAIYRTRERNIPGSKIKTPDEIS